MGGFPLPAPLLLVVDAVGQLCDVAVVAEVVLDVLASGPELALTHNVGFYLILVTRLLSQPVVKLTGESLALLGRQSLLNLLSGKALLLESCFNTAVRYVERLKLVDDFINRHNSILSIVSFVTVGNSLTVKDSIVNGEKKVYKNLH